MMHSSGVCSVWLVYSLYADNDHLIEAAAFQYFQLFFAGMCTISHLVDEMLPLLVADIDTCWLSLLVVF